MTAPEAAGPADVASAPTVDLSGETPPAREDGDARGVDGTDPTPTACPRCAAPVAPDDRFCEGCGSDLRVRRGSTTSAARAAGVRPCRRCGHRGEADADGFCPSCGMRAPDGTDHVEVAVDGGAAVSDRGLVRARNEDAVALGRATDGARPTAGAGPIAVVVCDGVSSARSSELAARVAADAALEQLLRGGTAVDGERRTRVAVVAAASAAADLVASHTLDAPSCTLVCGLVEPCATGPVITVGWVGDSRAYWLAADGPEPSRLLTLDHVAATAPPGTIDPAVLAARPDAITRWLGAGGRPEPDVVTLAPTGSGVLLLCSDGLWKYVSEAADLAELTLPALQEGGPAAAAAALTATALAAGGEDNVTVAVVPVAVVPVTGTGPAPTTAGETGTVPAHPRSTS